MTAPIRRRTRAREIAMQVLFQFDVRGESYASELGKSIEQLCRDEAGGGEPAGDPKSEGGAKPERDTDKDVAEFAARLVDGTLQHRAAIDQRLQGVTRNWDLRRMATVDRNVLRMAVYELMFCTDVPPKVSINEAIDLGKKFSTANSGGFVNGILDRIRIDLEKERGPAGKAKDAGAADDAAATAD
jgi:transcription antitermination factor NusB